MDTVSIILSISIVVNIVLAIGLRNLFRQNDALEDLAIETIKNTKEKVSNALLEMENADIRGSFEADDEVGVAFKDIKTAITQLNEIL